MKLRSRMRKDPEGISDLACKQEKSKTPTRITSKKSRNSHNSESCDVKLLWYQTSKRLRNGRRNKSQSDNKLDTNVFQSYLEGLWGRFPEEKRRSCAYLDCLWFSLYLEETTKAKVLKWIKKKKIFSKRYVFVPIVCWRHWSLLIFCHFGQNQQSKSGKPCMLLLDSLQSLDPKRLEPNIRRFVLDIYTTEGRKQNNDALSKIPLLIPKVPQQANGEECGLFVLYFINLFMESAPKQFVQDEYPYFLNEDWFRLEDLEGFIGEVHSYANNRDVKSADANFGRDGKVDDMELEQESKPPDVEFVIDPVSSGGPMTRARARAHAPKLRKVISETIEHPILPGASGVDRPR